MIITGFSAKGNRDKNQDAIFWDEAQKLFIVADGMGGEMGGEVASKTCIKSLMISLAGVNSQIEANLASAITKANDIVYQQAKGENFAMGTTVVIGKIVDNILYVANVGDSRAYILRGNTMKQITKDHTAAQELLDLGGITETELETHPNKGQLTKAIGTDKQITPDIYKVKLEKNDKLAFLTDGVYNGLADFELAELMYRGMTAQGISAKALESYGRDNASIIVVYNI